MFTKTRNEKGFTLIELLIVVAIIGILAAIAIPQFSQYRVRGYNSAANSDIRNMKIAEEAFVTDWQVYASTVGCGLLASVPANVAACTGLIGAGGIIAGPGNVTFPIAAAAIVAASNYPSAATNFSFGLSSGVAGSITTTAATAADYTAYAAHTQGNTVYGADSNFTQLKQAGKDANGALTTLVLKVPGKLLSVAPASTSDAAVPADLIAPNWSDM